MTIARESISDRIFSTFPAGQYCLPALLQILEVVETTAVPTACVECASRPRLFINPQFVAKHAQTPEKLLMLVMHELHHVLLGHTRLFRRVEPIDNLVFDAVINAMLCRLFPHHEYTALFRDFYKWGRFPECFLRPPPRWGPQQYKVTIPTALAGRKRHALSQLYCALYSPIGATYDELRAAFTNCGDAANCDTPKLLGDHRSEGSGSSSDGNLDTRTPALLDELRRITKSWPRPAFSSGGQTAHDLFERACEVPRSNRRSLELILRRVAAFTQSAGRRARVNTVVVPLTTPVPHTDRRSVVLTALGGRTMFYRTECAVRRVTQRQQRVHVYLDVSGSIGNLVGPLYGAVLACREMVHPTIHLFSTMVADVSLDELRRGVCKTTGGTSIECVASHMANKKVRRAVIITDGFVGVPSANAAAALNACTVGVAITPGDSSWQELDEFADHWTTLTTSST